ncbi:hypothetical protein BDV32DRAFT_151351 [Aspergillus pseudonomiae]|uniref:Protein HRI1 n=1 Tax=Aspergillus pseudonomiae TaxID=1506151 RepID=A0A5N7D9U6_9EURO|nr:uncharacterized protein BDV37DRAFT_283958 [Aspergillus pseudonomiae]KAB8258534.1 hypothetical protein BDV32DRAFT_151351 [Aspergillus pseudonomiae]KAE8403161.1 hypothetical protein BDV37DRAFT_283958 [Aspergillus pseudonomiae]
MASNTANPPTESRLSTRISIRWLPEPASETTDTIVMSVKGWYVDLRIDKKSGDIDWAIAGQRVTDSSDPRRVQFTHEIDSHNSFDDVDCGTFTTLPNGDDLETGSMARPDVPGAPVTEYEEVWRELTFKEGPEGSGQGASWVLESKHDIKVGEGEEVEVSRTFLARIWGSYLAVRQKQVYARLPGSTDAVVKAGKGVSARREEWDASTGWSAKYVLGLEGDSLPSAKDIEANEQLRTPGGTILVNGEPYTVRSYEFA